MSNTGLEFLPYKFTAKELDKETGLYYYGARYLDSKYSRWISADPALGEYIPDIGKGTAENFSGLPGMGGVYNTVNASLYHYAGNNPVKYTDPDGNSLFGVIASIGCYIGAGAVLIGGAAATTTGQIYLTAGAVKLSFALAATGTVLAADAINDANKRGQASLLSGFNGSASPSIASPSPLPPDPDDRNNNRNNKSSSNKLSQSEKDAKKLDNKGAEKFSQDKGYKDAHELKKDILRGQKDKTVAHYDIYSNAKTGEGFLINKSGTVVVPIE